MDLDDTERDRELGELDPADVVRMFGEERADIEAPAGALDQVEAEHRAMLAIALVPSMFPATSGDVQSAVTGSDLPDELVAAVQALPEATFDTVQEVWVALGGPIEEREGEPAAEAAAPAPPRVTTIPPEPEVEPVTPPTTPRTARAPARPVPTVSTAASPARARPPAPVAPTPDVRPAGPPRGRLGRAWGLARGAAALPFAASGAACSVGAGLLQRIADDLVEAAARVSGARR